MTLKQVLAFLLLALIAAGPARGEPALVEKLKGGGYNLYIRHAATDWSQSDHINAAGDWESCDPEKVRQLSGKGREDARAIGDALRKLQIPLGRLFASPYCRTMETARLIAGRDPAATMDLLNLRAESFGGGRDAIVARARSLVSRQPEPGVNDLFSAHGNIGRAAFAHSLAEGELLVLIPRGEGRFDKAGTLTRESLQALAGQ